MEFFCLCLKQTAFSFSGSGASKVKTGVQFFFLCCVEFVVTCGNEFVFPGSGASRVKTGVQYAASWLAPLGFKIVDQISEAAMLDRQVSRPWQSPLSPFQRRFHYLGHLPQFHQVPSREVGTVRKGSGNVRRSPWKKLSRKRQKRWTLNYDSLVILKHLNLKSKFSGHLKHSHFNQSKFLNDHLKHLDWLIFLKQFEKSLDVIQT